MHQQPASCVPLLNTKLQAREGQVSISEVVPNRAQHNEKSAHATAGMQSTRAGMQSPQVSLDGSIADAVVYIEFGAQAVTQLSRTHHTFLSSLTAMCCGKKD